MVGLGLKSGGAEAGEAVRPKSGPLAEGSREPSVLSFKF